MKQKWNLGDRIKWVRLCGSLLVPLPRCRAQNSRIAFVSLICLLRRLAWYPYLRRSVVRLTLRIFFLHYHPNSKARTLTPAISLLTVLYLQLFSSMLLVLTPLSFVSFLCTVRTTCQSPCIPPDELRIRKAFAPQTWLILSSLHHSITIFQHQHLRLLFHLSFLLRLLLTSYNFLFHLTPFINTTSSPYFLSEHIKHHAYHNHCIACFPYPFICCTCPP